MRRYENGFIYYYILVIGRFLDKFNVVEYFKDFILYIVKRKNKNSSDNDNRYIKSIAIDVFVLIKFIILIMAWGLEVNNLLLKYILWYLIISTVWTYFKYHFWRDDTNKSYHRIRRRFISLFISLFFITMTFAYFVDIAYESEFSIIKDNNTYMELTDKLELLFKDTKTIDINFYEATKYSFTNAFIGDFSLVKPVTKNGEIIAILQSVISFIYLTLILTKSTFE